MLNICKPKLTNLQQAILRLLFVKAGVSLNQRQIANAIRVSAPAVMKALPGLEKEDLIQIKQDRETKRWEIKLNRDNYKVVQLKRADNLKLIYETGLADYLETEFAGATIILFGSYSMGEDTANSDIDIAVVERKDKLVNVEDYAKKLNRAININFYDSWKVIHKHLRNNILNGIVLHGSVNI
jgi:predicted nucleotidyltransferase